MTYFYKLFYLHLFLLRREGSDNPEGFCFCNNFHIWLSDFVSTRLMDYAKSGDENQCNNTLATLEKGKNFSVWQLLNAMWLFHWLYTGYTSRENNTNLIHHTLQIGWAILAAIGNNERDRLTHIHTCEKVYSRSGTVVQKLLQSKRINILKILYEFLVKCITFNIIIDASYGPTAGERPTYLVSTVIYPRQSASNLICRH